MQPKLKSFKSFLTVSTAAVLCSYGSLSCAQVGDHAGLSVNGTIIPEAMVRLLAGTRQQGPLSNAGRDRGRVIEDLVNTELLYQAAKDSGVDSDRDVKLELELATKTLLSQFYVKHFMAQLDIDEKALRAAYDAVSDRVMVQMEYWQFDSLAEAEAFLEKAKASPKGTFDDGQLQPWQALENFGFANEVVAADVKAGSWLSAPIANEQAWYVWRCLDRSQISKPSFENAKEGIRQSIAQEKLHEHLADLRAQATISVPEGS